MGNSESQYTFQGSKNHSNTIPGAKQKPCSLKIRSIHAKDDKSLHGWGHGSGGAGYKSRSLARSCLSHFKSNQPYASRLGGPACKVSKGNAYSKHRTNGSGSDFQGNHAAFFPENGFHYVAQDRAQNHVASKDCNGHLNCYGSNESAASTPPGEDRRSPRVLIKTLGKLDGCLRVEFHSGGAPGPGPEPPEPPEAAGGPVRLLRYSPAPRPGAGSPRGPRPGPADARPRSSKGSSLSSESSWYDCPWGHAGEGSEAEGPFATPGAPDPGFPPGDAPKPFNQSSSLSSLRGLDPDAPLGGLAASGARLSDEDIGAPASLSHRVSFASDMDVPSRVGHREPGPYASFTLPCRRSKAFTEDASKKDTLKARMRRLSDWTGSLSRKKRKLQEPRSKEGSDYFDSRSDGLNVDGQGPFQASAALWSGGSAQLLPQRSESAHAIGSDSLRQDIYENFMRELEIGRTNTENAETSTETAESSSESLSSLEQLDLLFEKEQGVVRKAGWLFFKPLVTLQKERKLELVARRKWKQYWVTLKGCTLLFYETYGKHSLDQSGAPRCALFAEDSIVQAVPEHPKKEHVFCLSNSFGDVYLFQATSQTDLENWVTAIHSACASLFAKKHGKEDTVRLLKNQTKSLVQKIDIDSKMKKMAELQLSVVRDPKNRKAIENQIQQWEQNLEKFHMDLFRMRCYLASLQGGELPNPKSLLAATSRPSKLALGRLGVLSVSSFHALVCSRDDSAFRKRTLSLTQRGRHKKGIFSSLKGLDTLARKGKEKRSSITQVDDLLHMYGSAADGVSRDNAWEVQTYVHFQDNQGVSVTIKPEHRVEDILTLACKMRQLEPSHYGLQLRKSVDENTEYCVPAPYEFMQEQVYDEIEVFPLNVYDVQLTKTGGVSDFGFAVTAQVDGDQHLSRIFVSDVLPHGLAYGEGLRKGNEIMTLNGEAVSDLDLKQMEALFSKKSVGLTLIARPPDPKGTLCTSCSDSDLFSRDQKSLLPPPNQSQLLEEFLDNFKKNTANDFSNVPDITTGLKRSQTDGTLGQVSPREKAEQTFRVRCRPESQSAEQIAALCRSFNDTQADGMEGARDSQDPPPRPLARHLSDADRLRKVIQELVDTEKSYVKDLSCLFELYLEPLQNETFLTQDEMESLFGSLPEMLEFQKVFLETLEDGISASADFNVLETPSQFRKLLFSLGGSFLYYADHFKLYSGFCANHIKVQKVLERAKTDKAFKAFLDARNPTKQHSSTLESYLIKPVQRVLKYPLLLRELVSLTDHESEEHYHLTEALKAMEKVASHINEMQKIYEDYGTVFDQLVAEQSGTEKEVTELSMGELLMHAPVSWLNPFLSLGKARKDLELTVFVFKRAVILVYKEHCKLKKKLPSNSRPAHGSADLEPFKFRWLIPISALQVRLGNTAGTENNSIWELIHTKSEIEGRPETIFQLCCSDSDSKTNIVKVIRSILRENFRRHIKCELPLEKTCKDRLVPLKNRVPVSAKLASSRSLKVLKNSSSGEWPSEAGKGSSLDSDEGSLSSGTQSSGCHTAGGGHDALKHPHAGSTEFSDSLIKESDILSDDDEDYHQTLKQRSPTKDIEIQFQRLSISEDPDAPPAGQQAGTEGQPAAEQPKLVRGHFCAIKRKANSTRRDRGTLLKAQIRHQSLDSQAENANLDLSSVLEREFSVQSLASVVNEECFYETEGHGKA
ncbi:T-lymphoma invasion and metastasis-inducing protein 2 isoform X1 [Rousettus aegyptiacus]|uniref:T-lymphoma invasion and metastasis-inducing protein 2 isoform X1 n=1 Tax=Rousettus aegyptiacus TaxID=9407 RepID=UPI00168D1251|nr:T-lymphoma invasion and metastasis-inducing protein 2 isoform X1 [Rousettus aegyptiacus]XP_036078844.1 T-lymphoma invasion and metastasis-inducing protein 2 isoform X1 [Rousettus aegyptiacus]XP_036078846.1 T-lymphoma invasion and metastasis-inducing protein 2 isoform X1 [Rousettus aegyptiacus]XP_036078849.1 T-lymphoma invasion and metastasis-inducing protein 2 isoform X1 [Rousettus aegyptiacus]XP_036078857.1 T-lymphoma invasion and metastasis-inducing protein 2 isoform X1 [Rousettus aegyptia